MINKYKRMIEVTDEKTSIKHMVAHIMMSDLSYFTHILSLIH